MARAAAGRIGPLPELTAARVLAAYLPLRHELDPAPLAALSPALRVYPRITRGSLLLAFGPIRDQAALLRGPLGILEPPPGEDVPLAGIDAVIVPGLAFDRTGRRLGHGGGYYDATLPFLERALRIGLCRDEELVAELPWEAHDALVDLVATPTLLVRTGARRAAAG